MSGLTVNAAARTPLPLDGLIREAEAEVARVLTICNACRYCEGFCAVFPAMTRRLAFDANDAHFLANLCHQCGACLHACQYAPPHEFAVNVPQAMSRVRVHTYAEHAWPRPLGALYRRHGATLAVALCAAFALVLLVALAWNGTLWGARPDGNFYAVLPHNTMVWLFAPVFVFAIVSLAMGARRFWRRAPPGAVSAPAAGEATRDALKLRYLGGGHGEGCNEADDHFSTARRRFHHLTFYGFMACFAATCVATVWHYVFGWHAPYGWTSLPKLLGIPGGIALAIGTAGLFVLNLRRHPMASSAAQKPLDRGFTVLLFVTAVSGLALMVGRGSAGMPALLAFHLGAVLALFATLPVGKFAHAVYRGAALLRWAVERRQPNRLGLPDD